MAKIVATDKKTGNFDAETTAENLAKTFADFYAQLAPLGGSVTVKVGKDKQYDKEVAETTFDVPPSAKKEIVRAVDYIKSMFRSKKKGAVGRRVLADETILQRIYVDYRRKHPERPLAIVAAGVANAYNEETEFSRPISATYALNMAKKEGWDNEVERIETISVNDVETVGV